jgi:carbon starvation protein CstA
VTEWTKVVANPLGIAGFALFLVFGYLARIKKSDQHRWIAPMAFVMAVTALIGGLSIAYLQVRTTTVQPTQTNQSPAPVNQRQQQQVKQTSTGNGSPNVQGIKGSVTISVDQSSGKTVPIKPQ